jgi:hypothetical protein
MAITAMPHRMTRVSAISVVFTQPHQGAVRFIPRFIINIIGFQVLEIRLKSLRPRQLLLRARRLAAR